MYGSTVLKFSGKLSKTANLYALHECVAQTTMATLMSLSGDQTSATKISDVKDFFEDCKEMNDVEFEQNVDIGEMVMLMTVKFVGPNFGSGALYFEGPGFQAMTPITLSR